MSGHSRNTLRHRMNTFSLVCMFCLYISSVLYTKHLIKFILSMVYLKIYGVKILH